MPTLADFLLARIEEDAHLSGIGGPERRVWELQQIDDSRSYHLLAIHEKRVRAECEAKRNILLAHMPTGTELVGEMDDLMGLNYHDVDEFETIVSREENCMTCAGCPPAPCGTLRALALPYADHPDYDESWQP